MQRPVRVGISAITSPEWLRAPARARAGFAPNGSRAAERRRARLLRTRRSSAESWPRNAFRFACSSENTERVDRTAACCGVRPSSGLSATAGPRTRRDDARQDRRRDPRRPHLLPRMSTQTHGSHELCDPRRWPHPECSLAWIWALGSGAWRHAHLAYALGMARWPLRRRSAADRLIAEAEKFERKAAEIEAGLPRAVHDEQPISDELANTLSPGDARWQRWAVDGLRRSAQRLREMAAERGSASSQ